MPLAAFNPGLIAIAVIVVLVVAWVVWCNIKDPTSPFDGDDKRDAR